MSADENPPKGFSLRRWSRRKLEAARVTSSPTAATSVAPTGMNTSVGTPVGTSAADSAAPATAAATTAAASIVASPTTGVSTAPASIVASPAAGAPSTPAPTAPPPASALPADASALPPVESLTSDSDFAPFFRPQVDDALKRRALKQLLRDPRFNVMDGLDVYIDDYSKPDPIDPDIVKQMVQGRYIFDPPRTRVNERGEVEDVPPEEVAPNDAGAEQAAAEQAAAEQAAAEQAAAEQAAAEQAAAEQASEELAPAAPDALVEPAGEGVHDTASSEPSAKADTATPRPES